MAKLTWPPDFNGELARRLEIEQKIIMDPVMLAGAKALYRASPTTFMSDCCWVYEPRNAAAGLPTKIPVVLFQRQREYVEWLHKCFSAKISAPVEKSRDSGATWIASAFAVWIWLFYEGSSVGFGSRKEDLVDRFGDMNSIFEKIRSIIRNLPHAIKPASLSEKTDFNHMRIVNREMGSSIVGEAGDNIGRGGRTSIYIVDESAFLERPEMIDASLTANTDCRIDISSPRVGTVFTNWCATAREKFIFDLNDVPWHDDEWIKRKRQELDDKGLGHIFRREYLRDASAGIAGQLIPSHWVDAAVDACRKLHIEPTGEWSAALDVADGGSDKSALSIRHGIEVYIVKTRGDLTADAAGLWAYDEAARAACTLLRYDSIGVGAGAAAALRNKREIKTIEGWSAAGAVVNPRKKYEGNRLAEDMWANSKAQAWWELRDRFHRTYKAVMQGRIDGDPDGLISLSSEISELRELKSELSQVTYKHNPAGKVLIEKTPDGHTSPNRADSVMINFAPKRPSASVIGFF